MQLAGATLNQTPLDWDNNTHNILEALQQAKAQGVNLLCLPELCITGYGCEDMFLAPWVADKAWQQLQEITLHTDGIAVAVGLPVWYQQQLYNCVAMVSQQQILGFQAKQKLPNYGVHYEQRWFTPWQPNQQATLVVQGNRYVFGDSTYNIKGKKIGFEICEEAWNEDRPACRLVKENVDIILNPSGSHFALNKDKERRELVINSSKQFNCTYVYTNILGNEAGRIIYDGDVIMATRGTLIADGERFSKENIKLTQVKLSSKTNAVPAATLTTNQQFTKAVTLALFDYLRKSKSAGFVLSLSGGADSSTLLVLVAEMVKSGIEELGLNTFLERIHRAELVNQVTQPTEVVHHLCRAAYQGSANSSEQTFASAKALAESVGATFYHWPIQPSVSYATQTLEKVLGRQLTWQQDDTTLQNIQARTRSPLIWMLANVTNSILLTTSNRSEGSVGYTTMDGDTSGSLAPIAGVHKSFILQWLAWAEKTLNYSALHYVNNLQPTAELRPKEQTQTDEDDLMPYPLLQQIEELFVKKRQSPMAIFNTLKEEHNPQLLAKSIIRFFQLWSRNQWKRERIAPSFHISNYNIDPRSWFRFPILSGAFKEELTKIATLAANRP